MDGSGTVVINTLCPAPAPQLSLYKSAPIVVKPDRVVMFKEDHSEKKPGAIDTKVPLTYAAGVRIQVPATPQPPPPIVSAPDREVLKLDPSPYEIPVKRLTATGSMTAEPGTLIEQAKI